MKKQDIYKLIDEIHQTRSHLDHIECKLKDIYKTFRYKDKISYKV